MGDELAEVVDLDIKSTSDAFWKSTETFRGKGFRGKGFRTEPDPDRFPLPLLSCTSNGVASC
jgi:hypothetical protein